ncbi:MAG: TlyA family RNA methyltransferase [Promicromonosporaceae bacterium]|nr:TlyA family RNA methyltransferase [Promicromonosporaceae bacterium]
MLRVDAELVRRDLARSRAHAAELVRAGRVCIGGKPVIKPSTPITPATPLQVRQDPSEEGYASRAALKLVGALAELTATGSEFPSRIKGATCLDLGASTGGFTDVLLRRGAARVVALDVGHDQLLPRLRTDERVTVIEGANARELTAEMIGCPPDLVVGDLSFISLTLVLPALAQTMQAGALALLLVKPQFEVGRDRLGAGGVVRDPVLHRLAIDTVIAAGAAAGMRAQQVIPSPLPGHRGNQEFFVTFEREVDVTGESR